MLLMMKKLRTALYNNNETKGLKTTFLFVIKNNLTQDEKELFYTMITLMEQKYDIGVLLSSQVSSYLFLLYRLKYVWYPIMKGNYIRPNLQYLSMLELTKQDEKQLNISSNELIEEIVEMLP